MQKSSARGITKGRGCRVNLEKNRTALSSKPIAMSTHYGCKVACNHAEHDDASVRNHLTSGLNFRYRKFEPNAQLPR